jgi:glucose-6-phosphate 1-epimerase
MEICDTITWGDLPAIRLNHPSGATAIITLYGAHLVQWISADGRNRLFCSTQSSRNGQRAIRGGVPVIFPQFAAFGNGMRHGFARVSTWRRTAQGSHGNTRYWCEFMLSNEDLPSTLTPPWQHPFELRLQVSLSAQALEMRLQVNNTGNTPFSFATALHSYWQVDDLATCQISGLQGVLFDDQTSTTPGQIATQNRQDEATLHIDDKIDRIYRGVSGAVTLEQTHDQLELTQGWPDVVIWNPGASDAAALPDMDNAEYQRFICIEAANVSSQVLAPAASWANWLLVKAAST